MKDIELPPLSKFDHPEPRTMQWSDLELYAIKSYARAAIEADRAQRVPHQVYLSGRTLIDAARRDWPSTATHRARVLDEANALESALLASTPAPAQREPATPMDAHRAAYFMRRFLHEEKMLGPNEQAALHFTIAALEAMESAAQPQEPPQQERKISEALRRRGLTLVKTANGYDVLELGELTAQASGPQQERKPMTEESDDDKLVDRAIEDLVMQRYGIRKD